MTRRRPAYEPEPRIYSEHALAVMFGKDDEKFREMRPRLEAEGFPKRDDLLGGTDSAAAHRWLDQRAGFAAQNTSHDPIMEALYDRQT